VLGFGLTGLTCSLLHENFSRTHTWAAENFWWERGRSILNKMSFFRKFSYMVRRVEEGGRIDVGKSKVFAWTGGATDGRSLSSLHPTHHPRKHIVAKLQSTCIVFCCIIPTHNVLQAASYQLQVTNSAECTSSSCMKMSGLQQEFMNKSPTGTRSRVSATCETATVYHQS
jgi:hypothetical protein